MRVCDQYSRFGADGHLLGLTFGAELAFYEGDAIRIRVVALRERRACPGASLSGSIVGLYDIISHRKMTASVTATGMTSHVIVVTATAIVANSTLSSLGGLPA